MPDWKDFLAVFVLFWPAVASLSFLGFLCFVGLLFFISGALLIFCVFIYGAYALLRDSGSLDWLLETIVQLKESVTERVAGHVRQSFLISNESEIPKGPVLYVAHPHGLYGLSWFIHIALGITDWPSERPVLAVHSIFFKLPLIRELFQRHGCIEATEEAILETLKKGTSVVLLVGGIEELYHTDPYTIQLILKKRKGYARIAKKANVPLVPLLTVGESELFPVTDSWIWGFVQSFLYKTFHIALPLPRWSSLWSWGSLMYGPLNKPIQTYILPVIQDTSRKSQRDIREEYMNVLTSFAHDKAISLEILH